MNAERALRIGALPTEVEHCGKRNCHLHVHHEGIVGKQPIDV